MRTTHSFIDSKKTWNKLVGLGLVGFLAVSATGLMGSTLSYAAAPVPASNVRGLPDFTDLVEQVGPSVVNIRNLEKASAHPQAQGDAPDADMEEFFRRFGIPIPKMPKSKGQRTPAPEADDEPQIKGVGSGFILTSDGYVLTNAHVVEGADELLVTLPDQREFKAKLIGADKRSDVAVVKIEASGLPAVKLGDVNKLRVGEWVIAIGSPFGLENSVTAGIVSAKGRDTGDYLPFIQTDVAINPGNSGGPLINMRGEVVGINNQIYSRSGGYMGIAFSIPIDEAIRVSDQLRSHGRVSRGRIGVQIDQVSKEVAESLGMAKAQGALVRGVEAGSPADKAGVQAGDIILKFDGKDINKSIDLPRIVGNTKPGTHSTLGVFRRGTHKDLSILVAEIEAENATVTGQAGGAGGSPSPNVNNLAQAWGLTLTELNAAQKRELKIQGGLLVTGARDAAARAGLREGDVIIAVANVEVASLKDLEAVLAKVSAGKSLPVLYRRGDWTNYTVLKSLK
jgi:serine protease Do